MGLIHDTKKLAKEQGIELPEAVPYRHTEPRQLGSVLIQSAELPRFAHTALELPTSSLPEVVLVEELPKAQIVKQFAVKEA